MPNTPQAKIAVIGGTGLENIEGLTDVRQVNIDTPFGQRMFKVILPPAIRNMLPSLVTQFIVLFKDTSLASIIGMMDLTKAAQTVTQREIRPFEMYLFIAVVYWICTYSMSRFSRWLEVRMSPEKAPSKPAALREAARAAAA